MDAAKAFQELNDGLIPPDETILAVIRSLPKGEAWRRSRQMNLRIPKRPAPTPIAFEGAASSWPNRFARHESVPDTWSADIDWFFWVVITDKQLHAFEGRGGKGFTGSPTAGPEGAHYPLDQIDEIAFQKGLISQLVIRFKDGSSVELEVGKQKLEHFLDAIRPFVRPDSVLVRNTGWMPGWAVWSLGIALLVGGTAVSIGATADAETTKFLEKNGVSAIAKVAAVRDDVRQTASGSTAGLDLEFKDEFGLSAEATVPTCGERPARAVGDKVEILYDPDEVTVAQLQECPQSQATWLLIVGVIAIGLGILSALRAWSWSGWRHRRWGIPLAVLGAIVGAMSFDVNCSCGGIIYISAALVIIGVAAQFGRPVALRE
jgi:hypothetical protein